MSWRYVREVSRRFDPMTGEPDENAHHWVRDESGLSIVLVSMHRTENEAADIARLVTAAPALLEALKEIATPLNSAFLTPRLATAVNAAIAKAEGREVES